MIEKGLVKVNGKVELQQGTKIDVTKDVITVDGKKLAVSLEPDLFYFMVNKPKGYICSNVETQEGKGKRVIDILQPWIETYQKGQINKNALPPRLFTVGRLDVASYGLILVTNDGQWAQKVIHPSAGLTKEYMVLVDKTPRRNHLDAILAGAEVDGTFVQPKEVAALEGSNKLRIVVGDGKKHEVRILVANAGLEVVSLKRTRIGGLRVPPSLGLGGYKQMTQREIKSVTDRGLQEALQKNAWQSASILLVKDEPAKGEKPREGSPAPGRRVR